MIWQSKINDGITKPPAIWYWWFSNSSIKATRCSCFGYVGPNGTDWMDAIFDPGLAQQYKVTVTSGGASKFMMSMEYVDREGAQIMTAYSW